MKISQREARRLQKRVTALESQIKRQRQVWSQDYIGAEIARVAYEPLSWIPVAVKTARKLNHAVVVIANDDGLIRFVALPHPSESV